MKGEMPHCATTHVHGELLEKLSSEMPDENLLCDLAELYKVFGDSTRIKILYVQFEEEVCVCDLAEALIRAARQIAESKEHEL